MGGLDEQYSQPSQRDCPGRSYQSIISSAAAGKMIDRASGFLCSQKCVGTANIKSLHDLYIHRRYPYTVLI
jgi:hypothetical protein